jgi:hypothetical protein
LSWFSRDPGRPLTDGERAIAAGLFGTALDPDNARLHRAKWWPLQPRNVVMAPDGDIWFHPKGGLWREDFSIAPPRLQGLFVHELTHVWQHQSGLFLPLRRHPFCRYRYDIVSGCPLRQYGIEQQAMIVEHAFVARRAGSPNAMLDNLLKEAGLAG